MPRAVIYARFSSDKQSDRSIDDQVALCRGYCERESFDIVKVYEDRAISGASTVNRLGWLTLMRDARAGHFDIVVAEALDRISRDQEDLAGIHKRLRFAEIEMRTVQDGLAGELHVGVKGLLGSLYLKDLAQKTKRGQAGVIRDGRHNGGRSFGYRPVAGEPGRLAIDEAEAETVRRILNDYCAGYSPRDIAAALNREGVPGPRGGVWNASAIAGSRKRQNGILQNALYVGRIVWNRQSFAKDPYTGNRVSRPNPPEQWMTAEAPELRIVPDDLWNAVQARKQARGGDDRHHRTRPKHLLSGLLKCGCCGSGYVVAGRDKRGLFLGCSRHRETGLCDNRHTLAMATIEARVLDGIEKQLTAPDLIAEVIRECHRKLNELERGRATERADGERRLKKIEKELSAIVDLLVSGDVPARSVKQRMTELEAERTSIEATLGDVHQQPPVQFHPKAAERYREKVRDLKQALAHAADPENREAAIAGIRDLVEKIVIHPTGPYKPVDIEIHGQLAALLRASEGVPTRSVGVVVAGARNNHTHRLPPLIVTIRSCG